MRENVDSLEERLYKTMYPMKRKREFAEVWKEIIESPKIQKNAIKVIKERNGKHYIKAPSIVYNMLRHYKEVDKKVYEELIKIIYSDQDIAMTIVEDSTKSFLLLSLLNQDMSLTQRQKDFVVKEAMRTIGTTATKKEYIECQNRLDTSRMRDEIELYEPEDKSLDPVGPRTRLSFQSELYNRLGLVFHGHGLFDIRYYVLKNHNWSMDEKKELAQEFWFDEQNYSDYYEEWQWNIVNKIVSYLDDEELASFIDANSVLTLEYSDLFYIMKNEEYAKKIFEEIEMLKIIQELRPLTNDLNKQMTLKLKFNN